MPKLPLFSARGSMRAVCWVSATGRTVARIQEKIRPNERVARPAWQLWMVRVVLFVVGLALAVRLGAFVRHSIAALQYPLPLDGIEGTLLDATRRWLTGQPLYQSLGFTEFRSTPYPPLDYVAMAVTSKIGFAPFVAGRLVSLVGTLVACVLLSCLVWRYSHSRFATFAAPALYVSVVPVYLWSARVKPDMLAAAFTLFGLLATQMAVDAWRRNARRAEMLWLIGAGAGFIAAVYTKQLALLAPVAAVLYLFAVRGWRLTLFWTVACAFVAAAVAGALILVSDGAFYDQVVGYNAVPWQINRFSKFAVLVYQDWAVLVGALLTVGVALYRYVKWRDTDTLPLLPLLYGIIAPVSLIFAGVYGANHNHIIETMQAETVLGCVALGLVLRGWTARKLPNPVLLVALALLVAQTIYTFIIPDWYHDYELPPPQRTQAIVNVIGGLAHKDGTLRPVLADDVGLLVAANLPAPYNDPSTMGPLAQAGKWDARGLLDQINRRAFAAIVLPFDINAENAEAEAKGRWANVVLDAIRQNYTVLYRDIQYTYVPKK